MAQIFKPSANTMAKLSLIAAATLPWIIMYGGSTISRSAANTLVGVPLSQPVPFSHKHHAWELGIDCRYCHTSVEKSAVAGIPGTETCMSCHSQIWTNSPILEPVRKSYETGTPIKWADDTEGWNRVNKVPEFVYFNHSIHINRGVNCNQCHGAVQKMTITWKGKTFFMSWCLECHRDPEKFLYKDEKNPQLSPSEQVFNLYLKNQMGVELSAKERSLLDGQDYAPTAEEEREGLELVKLRGVAAKQLTDCWICHR